MITSIALDSEESPIFSYSDQGIIKLAYKADIGWKTETIITSDDQPFGQLTSLAIDSNGVLHLAYTKDVTRESPGVVGTIVYARGTPIP